MTRVAINGFGRIGRCSFKHFIEDDRFADNEWGYSARMLDIAAVVAG